MPRMTRPDTPTRRLPAHVLWIGLAIAVALGYLFGLGGDHIPRNGDELVYANIARLTADSGHWLPLLSAWDFMRNTKPPLLFWQAMVAGGWGDHWTLLNLRLPSVFYTWCTALMVGLLTWKIVGRDGDTPALGMSDTRTGVARANHAKVMGAIAALVYLSFFTTYRYGRPFMTSAPETFWLFGVFFALAWSPRALMASRWKFPVLAGVALGIGCLYKSFAMVVPVGVGLALCYQCVGARRAPWAFVRPGLIGDALKVLLCCLLGLGIFSLWFAVDPQPGEVWREFVVGENAGKMNNARGYFQTAFSGSGGMFTILTGYFSNALYLLPVSVGCFWAAWRAWRARAGTGTSVSDAEKILWLWLLALALVFMLPTQRSTRYLIPAMPALAVLIALYWQRIGRGWFMLSLLICAGATLAMGLVGYGAVRATQNPGLYSPLLWAYLAVLVLACLSGLVKPAWSRPITTVAAFGAFIALAWVTLPFNGALARFSPATNALLQGQDVAVPNNFNGHFERYTFIIPGAQITGYDTEQPVDFADVSPLLAKHRYVLVQRRVGQPPCSDCRVIDERWDLRSRQNEPGGALAAFKSPETFWYAKEYLVERLAP